MIESNPSWRTIPCIQPELKTRVCFFGWRRYIELCYFPNNNHKVKMHSPKFPCRFKFVQNKEPRLVLKRNHNVNDLVNKSMATVKNPLLQNHWLSFNQTWQKVFLCKRNSGLFKWRVTPLKFDSEPNMLQ